MQSVINPVLPGFHPDPSICRVGDTFYIANSTFEWFPGVGIYRSDDLIDWELAGYALTRRSQLDMAGNPASGGIWAPCLSYADGRFWLIYTDVKEWAGMPPHASQVFKDAHNYLVTAESIEGPWSEPIYLNSSGFDPSLFHDEDGRKWLLNMIWDYRPGRHSFAGTALQEYDPVRGCLTGPIKNIFLGSDIKLTEGPHLYRRNGWYYLLLAEGGTSYGHAATLARSRKIDGPYELHPQTPLLSSVKDRSSLRAAEERGAPMMPHCEPGLQKAGHASMAPVDDEAGEWVLAHLCARPLPGTERCPLGRETALQKLVWRDDEWPWPESRSPLDEVRFSLPAGNRSQDRNWSEDFDGGTWAAELNTLRLPADERFDLKSRPGWLRLAGAESPLSRFRQTLLARRVEAFAWEAQTCIEFNPEDFQQFAGLVIRYNEANQLHLVVTANDEGERILSLLHFDRGLLSAPPAGAEPVPTEGAVELRASMSDGLIRFSFRQAGAGWRPIPGEFDASIFSDDYADPMGFTGMFVGIGCYDLSGRRNSADFDFLSYRELD